VLYGGPLVSRRGDIRRFTFGSRNQISDFCEKARGATTYFISSAGELYHCLIGIVVLSPRTPARYSCVSRHELELHREVQR